MHSEPLSKDYKAPTAPAGTSYSPYTFKASQVAATQLPGGSVKIIDSRTFNTSKTIAMAELTIEPGAIRYVLSHCEMIQGSC